ncbi:MAG: capsule assembly Wzi family protein [Cyclobacteriaceae bacterium]
MKRITIILSLFLLSLTAKAQIDSTEVFVEAKVAAGSQGYLPQWIGYNQYGLLDPNENDGYLRASVISPLVVKGKFSIETGIDGILKPQDIDNSFINLAYGIVEYGAISLRGGRYLMEEGGFNHELSSGHMFRSINIRPNWRFGAGIYEFADLPFTKGYVQVKGKIELGYLEDDRPVSDAKYHEKSAYIRSNKLPINIIIGLNHSVIYDGIDENGTELPGDFLEAFFARSATNSGNISDSINAAGAHFGLFDIGFEIPMKAGSIRTYFHQPISDKSGFQSNFTANKDYVLGIEIKFDDHSFIKSLLYENIYTLHQSGQGTFDPIVNGRFFTLGQLRALPDYDRFILNNYGIVTEDATWQEFREIVRRESNNGYNFSGRDDYYNNGQYPQGNTYYGQQIGNSLFTTKERLLVTNGEDGNYPFFIINNRIQAHHIGMKGRIKSYDFKFMATLTNNYGTYGGFYGGNRGGFTEDVDYLFRRARSQQALLIEVSRKLTDKLSYEVELGADFGDFGNNVGFSGRIRYQLR